MIVLGLTGSIGMGKSTVAGMFEALGVPVHSADAAVHALYAGAAAPLVEAAFPGTVREGTVDRLALSKRVLGDAAALSRLEAIVHPLVRGAETQFLEAARASGAPLVVLDIPLLYETGGETRCDAVAVVSAPAETQRARVLARPGMTPERFAAILQKQVLDEEKRRRADIVIETDVSLEETRAAVERIVREMTKRGDAGSGTLSASD